MPSLKIGMSSPRGRLCIYESCDNKSLRKATRLKFLGLKQRKLYWVGAFRNNRSAAFCLHYGCAVWNGLYAHPATSKYAPCSREMSSRITHLTWLQNGELLYPQSRISSALTANFSPEIVRNFRLKKGVRFALLRENERSFTHYALLRHVFARGIRFPVWLFRQTR